MDIDAGDMIDEQYPEDSVNGIALARLKDIADIVNGDNSDEKDHDSEDERKRKCFWTFEYRVIYRVERNRKTIFT